jgi:hypothetical protein
MKERGVGSRARAGRSLVLLGAVFLVAGARPDFGPRSYDLERFDPRAVEEAAASGRPLVLRFFGEAHRVRIEPSEVRSRRFEASAGAPGAERALLLGRGTTFKGSLEGEPDSMVRLSIGARGIRGLIKSSRGWTFIEPAPGAAAAAGQHRVFTDGDLDPDDSALCAEPVVLDAASGLEGPAEEEPSARVVARPAGELRVLELAVDADFEFYSTYQGGTLAEIEGIVNLVDGIYEAEIGISVEIVSVQVRDAEPDPYTSTNPGTLLGELRSHWNANHGGIARDAVHLFTGKDLDSSTVGIAYLSVVCSTGSAYGLSQDIGSDAIMPLVVAHEMGHNLSANHDATGTTPRYIMYPSIGSQNLDEFSSESKAAIEAFVGGVSCLALDDGEPPPDPPPEPPPEPEPEPEPEPPPRKGGGGGGPIDPLALAIVLGVCLARLAAGGREDAR